jgi:hypothetical protein
MAQQSRPNLVAGQSFDLCSTQLMRLIGSPDLPAMKLSYPQKQLTNLDLREVLETPPSALRMRCYRRLSYPRNRAGRVSRNTPATYTYTWSVLSDSNRCRQTGGLPSLPLDEGRRERDTAMRRRKALEEESRKCQRSQSLRLGYQPAPQGRKSERPRDSFRSRGLILHECSSASRLHAHVRVGTRFLRALLFACEMDDVYHRNSSLRVMKQDVKLFIT